MKISLLNMLKGQRVSETRYHSSFHTGGIHRSSNFEVRLEVNCMSFRAEYLLRKTSVMLYNILGWYWRIFRFSRIFHQKYHSRRNSTFRGCLYADSGFQYNFMAFDYIRWNFLQNEHFDSMWLVKTLHGPFINLIRTE